MSLHIKFLKMLISGVPVRSLWISIQYFNVFHVTIVRVYIILLFYSNVFIITVFIDHPNTLT